MNPTLDVEHTLETAIAQQQAGSWQEAETLYREILRADPKQVEALNLLGLVLQDTGRHAEALDVIGQAITIDPDFAEAFANQARGLNILQRWDEARAASLKATNLDPELGEAWQQLGLANLHLNLLDQARDAYRKAEELLPDSIDIQAGLAEAAKHLRDHATVVETLVNLLDAQPDDINILINLSIALTVLDRLDEALPLQHRALELDPNNRQALHAMAATMFAQRYDLPELESVCRRLLRLDPGNLHAMSMLAGTLGWLGRFSEAKATYSEMLEIQPDHQNARSMLSVLASDSGSDPNPDLEMLRERLLDVDQTIINRVSAGFSIGKNLERAGDFDGAFEAYALANRVNDEALRKAGLAYKPDDLRRYVDWNIEHFRDTLFTTLQPFGNRSEMPVFIVGMPRSGTSLVEQIAASHPDVFGGGERRDIDGIMNRLTRGPSSAIPNQWDLGMMRLETNQHIASMRDVGGGAARVTDKLPDNIFFLGQIALLFPAARIIVCRRDIRDVCLSIFSNHFTDSLNWSNALEEIGVRAMETERIFNHWRQHVPLRMLEIKYETLTANLESESRRLIDFLGLDWNPACLEFHKTERAVATVSYMQIRQPIYDSSVGRWRRFERHLGPLLKALEGHPDGDAKSGHPDGDAKSGHPDGDDATAAN